LYKINEREIVDCGKLREETSWIDEIDERDTLDKGQDTETL
jgi:hypothetical protein